MKRVQRHTTGCVRFDKRRGTWNFLFYDNGVRRSKLIGTKRDFPTKASAWAVVTDLSVVAEQAPPNDEVLTPIVLTLVEQFRQEKMPQRHSTRQGYECWFRNHIVPKWGDSRLVALQPRPVELWLQSLKLAPKSRVHIKTLIRELWDFAMWRGDVRVMRNPMELVTIKGASKRTRKPRSLTVPEFRVFVSHLDEPFRTIALVCVCFGLRISECLALKWSDIDWLNAKLSIERAIVGQRVDVTKTPDSAKPLAIGAEMLTVLQSWKQATQYSEPADWVFASPIKRGLLPWSYPWVWRVFRNAASAAQIDCLGTHTMRHTYRSWLDAVGTTVAVQQKLMRHADVRTTLNIYGDCVTNEMVDANAKIASLALNGAQQSAKVS